MEKITSQYAIKRWLFNVSRIMFQRYYIDSTDAGWDDIDVARFYETGLSPSEFIEWYAEKYSLLDLDGSRISTSSFKSKNF